MDYNKEEIEFIQKYISVLGIEEISKKLERPIGGILMKVKRLKLPVNYSNSLSEEETNKITFNIHKPFVIDFNTHKNPKELAYWLGYFWADGYIDQKGGMRIKCVRKDIEAVEHVFDKVTVFNKYYLNRPNRQPQMECYVFHKPSSDLLKSLGKYTNSSESHQKIMEFIPEQYRNHFIRGFIDGDGCYYHRKNSTNVCFSLSGNYNQDWSYFQKYFKETFHFEMRVLQRTSGKNKHSELLNYSTESLKRFVNQVYGENDSIWLPRKYDKIKHLLENDKFILLSPEN